MAMGMTASDLVIEALARDEVLLRERIASLESDVVAYRGLSQQALTMIHDLTIERDRLRQQNRSLQDENRALREELRKQAVA